MKITIKKNFLSDHKIFLLVLLALIIRLAIAAFFFGSWDTESVYVIADLFKKGSFIYNDTWRFNNPPVWIWLIGILAFIADKTGIPLSFWAKTPFILADFGVAFLIYKLSQKLTSNKNTPVKLSLIYLFSPVSLWVSAYQGQLESLMLFLVLLSVWFLTKDQENNFKSIVKSSLALGMATTIKLVPLGLIPVFLIYLLKKFLKEKESAFRILGKLGIFGILGVLPVILVFIPYLSVWENGIIPHVIGYKTAWGIWGPSLLLRNVLEYFKTPNWFLDLVSLFKNQTLTVGMVSIISYLIIFWRNYSLLTSVFLMFLAITVFSPFLAPQYLLWVVPFWLLQRQNLRFFILYNFLTIISFFLLFTIWQMPEIFAFWSRIFAVESKNLQLIPYSIVTILAWILVLVKFFKTL